MVFSINNRSVNSKKKISIYYNHGKKFSEISKDKNKIHLDKIVGYNSIFGSNICLGCLILIKIIKI